VYADFEILKKSQRNRIHFVYCAAVLVVASELTII